MTQKANNMGLFGKKKEVAQPTGFQQFVGNDKKYHWVADYIDNHNEIKEDDAHLDMQSDAEYLFEIRKYTMPKFKKLVAKLYAQYLGRTIYYGKTLPEALKKLQDRNPKIAAKFAGPEA